MLKSLDSNKQLGIAITAFVLILVGIALIDPIADSVYDARNTYSITNESFAGVNATAVALTYDDFEAVSEVRNSSHAVMTVTTDYTVGAADGEITVRSGTGTYYADYVYYPDGYVSDSTSRILLNLLVIFFAIGVLAFGVGYAKKSIEGWNGNGRI